MDKQQDLLLADIHWFSEDNVARSTGLFRDDADESALTALLVPGWDGQLGRPAVTLMTDAEKAEAVKRLDVAWKTLREAPLSSEPRKVRVGDATISVSPSEMVRVFESIYTRKGKLITPTYKAATCFRRFATLPLVNTIRVKTSLPVIDSLPCVIRDYANSMEQFTDNIRENLLKTAGSRGMSNADKLGAVKRLFQLGATESRLSALFGLKRGMAQKFHRLCQLDAAHPELKIAERIIAGDLKDGSFDKEKVKALIDNGATDADVKAFIDSPNAGNATKIMARKDIEALGKQCPVELVKLVCTAILANDGTMLTAVNLRSAAINEAVKAVMA